VEYIEWVCLVEWISKCTGWVQGRLFRKYIGWVSDFIGRVQGLLIGECIGWVREYIDRVESGCFIWSRILPWPQTIHMGKPRIQHLQERERKKQKRKREPPFKPTAEYTEDYFESR